MNERSTLPLTLSRYIGRYFLLQMLMVLGVMAGLIVVMDMIELMRRAASKDHIGLGQLIEMAVLKLPYLLQRVIPFAVLIGSILTLTRLTKTQELIVARAAGVSVWQFLSPSLIAVFGVGTLIVTVINPLSAAMLSRFEHLEASAFKGRTSLLAVSDSGLWLRQVDGESNDQQQETIVHALRVSPQEMRLFEVILFTFDHNDRFISRIDADTALLHDGYWQLTNAITTAPGTPAERHPEHRVPTNLTANQIQESFASPETMSFWALPGFIKLMEEAGFSAMRHRLYWHTLLATPFFLCAMVLVGAIFSLRPHRMGGTGMLFATAVMVGFGVYFTSDVIQALALSGTLPTALAAWATTLVASIIGTAGLMHLEDG